jgi:hypothetical protein
MAGEDEQVVGRLQRRVWILWAILVPKQLLSPFGSTPRVHAPPELFDIAERIHGAECTIDDHPIKHQLKQR